MSSKSNSNTNTTSTGAGGEFKITFYSTSPKEESKSKYPMQTKTSYTLDQCGGDTEINFGKTLAPRPKTRITGFKTDRKKKDEEVEATTDTKKRNKKSDSSSNTSDSNMDVDSNVRSRSGRICKKPQRYEPIETVTDDFDDGDYDSDDSFEN
jgi:hypothetical protein